MIFKNTRIKTVIAFALCTSIIFGAVSFLSRKPIKAVDRGFLSYTPSQQDIDDAKKQREEARQKAEEASGRVNELQQEKNQLSGELEELKGLSDEQMAQYREISQEYAAALIAKEEALDSYIESQENLLNKRQEYAERIGIMFAYENKSTLEILLSSDSLAGFFTNLELISLIGDADLQMIDQLTIAMDDAELKNQLALQEAEDMQAIADQKMAELKELEDRIGVTEAALEDTSTSLSRWQQKEDEFQAEADRLDEEIRELQRQREEEERRQASLTATAAAKRAAETTKAATPTPKPSGGGNSGGGNSGGGNSGGGSAPVGAKMTWPYPGDYTVYSGYGMRYHPVYHYDKMHWGVDLGGSYGNPIVAAADGTVIKVDEPVEGQNTGSVNYGNYCVIDHGNGITTCYAHCRDVYVSVGDKVSAGQTIAECGSTGTSTGPHLHFEVRVNGQKVDPVPYIKG
ncbi:MAG: peptidoglycan DD-metalloendopeptidase family protein [Clostridiales bacterium]|nr:peptidoglycan DD-metalloendopeptidase family protein [Clostridiales bacterium]